MAQQPISGLDHLTVDISRSHTVSHTRVISTQRTQKTNIHALGGIRNCHPSSRNAAGLSLRPHGHRDRHECDLHNSLAHNYLLNSCRADTHICDNTSLSLCSATRHLEWETISREKPLGSKPSFHHFVWMKESWNISSMMLLCFSEQCIESHSQPIEEQSLTSKNRGR